MANIYSNDLKEILNSTVINRNIDCSIPCNILLDLFCCCPTQVINYFPPGAKDFKEMFMILLSLTPYPTVFLLICLAAYFRTSRSVLILVMVFLENFTVIALKILYVSLVQIIYAIKNLDILVIMPVFSLVYYFGLFLKKCALQNIYNLNIKHI